MMQYRPLFEGKSGQTLRLLARRLAAYLPTTITRQILNDTLPQPGESRWLQAATMFVDVSGFTRMAEALATDGPRGAEELNRALLMTFTALVNAIHDAGGTVSHFYGDAMMVYFPDEDGQAAERALASAQFMQSLVLTNFAQVTTKRADKQQSVFDLSIKIGVGYGLCLEMTVGDPARSLEFVLAGTAVTEAVAAQQQAQAGQVVASHAVLAKTGLSATNGFRVVDEVTPVPGMQTTLVWEAFEQTALHRLLDHARAFIPHALYERLQDRNTQYVAEHRPVTTMFVRFTGIDFEAENAGARLQAYYQWASDVVARYGGRNSRINRLLMGDKGNQLHILFGAPVAPDAPDQAIRCALALQQEKPPFIRGQWIGLVAGRAFAGAVGSQNRREYTAVGSVVNLSARLPQYCPDGAVVVDEATAERVHDQIEFVQLPPAQIKGRASPVPLYRVTGERTVATQIHTRFVQWEKPPVGRRQELATLLQTMDKALQGVGGIVAIYGPYGEGQLRLMASGVRHWLHSGGRGLLGVCQPHMADVPFAPWQAIWRDFFGLMPHMDRAMQSDRVFKQAHALCPDCGDDITLWHEVIGLPYEQEPVPAEERLTRFINLVRGTLAAVTAARPLLIILEDIHWADQPSLNLLHEMASFVRRMPVLVLVSYRQSADFFWPTLSRPDCTAIPLRDLPADQARQLIQQRLGTVELPVSVEQRLGIRDRQGWASPVNPLFLIEMLKMMLSLGVLQKEEDANGNGRVLVDEDKLAEVQVPDTVNNVLLTRLDQLPATSRSLLQVASVIGREFDLSTLVKITPGMTPELATQVLQDPVAAEMVQMVGFEPESIYMFQHALLHEVVYQSLPYARRQALHAAIAELLVERHQQNLKPVYPVLSYHYGQTDQHQAGLQYTLAAANEAIKVFANKGAADLYQQALIHLEAMGFEENWETAVDVYLRRAKVLSLTGQFTQAMLSAADALKLCLVYGDIAQTLPIYSLMAGIRYHQARYQDVKSLADKVINALVDTIPTVLMAEAFYLTGRAAGALFDFENALDALTQAEALYQSSDDKTNLSAPMAARGEIFSWQQQSEKAIETLQRAVDEAKIHGSPLQMGGVLLILSQAQLRAGEVDAALATANSGIGLVRSISQNRLAHFLLQRTAVWVYLAHHEEALADLQVAAELLGVMDDVPGQLWLALLWGEYAIATGEWSQAGERLAQVGHLLAAQQGEVHYVTLEIRLWLAMGQVARETNRDEQAKSWLKKALTAVDNHHLIWWRPAILYQMGLLALKGAKKRKRKSINLFQSALRAVDEGGCPDELPLILLQLGLLTQESIHRRRWQYLEACVASAHERARQLDRVHCFQEAGAILVQSNDERLRRIGAGCLALISTAGPDNVEEETAVPV